MSQIIFKIPPMALPLDENVISKYFPNRLEFLLITVCALPNASSSGSTRRICSSNLQFGACKCQSIVYKSGTVSNLKPCPRYTLQRPYEMSDFLMADAWSPVRRLTHQARPHVCSPATWAIMGKMIVYGAYGAITSLQTATSNLHPNITRPSTPIPKPLSHTANSNELSSA